MGDGMTYTVKETHFHAPDGVMSLGIDRAALRPVGPIDPALDIGGPAYVGIIVFDTKTMDVFLVAPGSSTGHLVVMQHLNAGRPAPNGIGQGARGIAGWSFESRDLTAVFERARAYNTTVLSPIARRLVPGLGMLRTLVLATPDGMPIEIIEAAL